jgi:iron complex outermembrane receptor protein
MTLALTALRWEAGLAADANVNFDIEEQPASTALLEFAQQARLSILFPGGAFEGITTGPLVGTYPIQQALDLLLEGTGISATYVAATGQLVVRADPPQEQLDDEPLQNAAPPPAR